MNNEIAIAASLAGLGLTNVADIHILTKTGTAGHSYWTDKFAPDRHHTSLVTAESRLVTGRGDTLLLTPDSHSLAATLTWDLNNSNLVGKAPPTMLNGRARIGMSTTFTPMITISGYGNYFRNLYTMHGTAAGDYVGWNITGDRNVFDYIHFGGPMNAAQGGHASYEGVKVTSSECYFKNSVFGVATIERDELTPNLTITIPSTGYAHHIYEDCDFILNATDTDPYFVKFANTSGMMLVEFKGKCRFIAMSSNMAVAPAVAFTFTGGSTCAVVMSPECELVNVTNWCASASHKFLWLPTTFAATADELNLIAKNNQTF